MRVITTNYFQKQIKALSRKYRNISTDITRELRAFNKECVQYLGARLYKVRIRSSDMSRGKSGGLRLIVLCIEVKDLLIPVVLYHKSVQDSITESELAYHLACIRAELNIEV